MRHETRPINSQGWVVAIVFTIAVLLLWAAVFWFHTTHYRSYRDVSAVSMSILEPVQVLPTA